MTTSTSFTTTTTTNEVSLFADFNPWCDLCQEDESVETIESPTGEFLNVCNDCLKKCQPAKLVCDYCEVNTNNSFLQIGAFTLVLCKSCKMEIHNQTRPIAANVDKVYDTIHDCAYAEWQSEEQRIPCPTECEQPTQPEAYIAAVWKLELDRALAQQSYEWQRESAEWEALLDNPHKEIDQWIIGYERQHIIPLERPAMSSRF